MNVEVEKSFEEYKRRCDEKTQKKYLPETFEERMEWLLRYSLECWLVTPKDCRCDDIIEHMSKCVGRFSDYLREGIGEKENEDLRYKQILCDLFSFCSNSFEDVKYKGDEVRNSELDILGGHELGTYFRVDGYKQAYAEILEFLNRHENGELVKNWNDMINIQLYLE